MVGCLLAVSPALPYRDRITKRQSVVFGHIGTAGRYCRQTKLLWESGDEKSTLPMFGYRILQAVSREKRVRGVREEREKERGSYVHSEQEKHHSLTKVDHKLL